MFVNRHQELEPLERMFQSEVAEFFVLYGRRRIGKTELLLQFCKNKRSIYFLASQMKEQDHLQQLTETARHVINDPLLQSLAFNDWESALIYFAQQAQEERLILVLDEFQYLCEDNAALPSLIQRFWDLHGKNSKLFLILCGSQVGFMEREVLAGKLSLYRQCTGQLQLMPLSYRDSGYFFSEYTAREKLTAYSILGGIPAYLNRFALSALNRSSDAPQEVFERHIKAEFLTSQGYLYNEMNFLLRTELREPRTYASILQAMAMDVGRLGRIAHRAGISPTDANKYLSVLRELGLVRRETPITEPTPQKSKKGLYKIMDNYLKFWFRFVLPNRSLIESGNTDMVYQRIIVPHFPLYMGRIFENICRQYVERHWKEKLKVPPKRIGGHWGPGLEIDILTENVDKSHWFGECKWRKGLVGENILNRLIENATKVPDQWQHDPRYVLFSVDGFTDALKQRAKKKNIVLIEVNDLF